MGNNIKESSIDFNINRSLRKNEMEEIIKYCTHDVEQLIEIFKRRESDFRAHVGLIKLACENRNIDLNLLSKTQPQLSAIILNANYKERNDEFDIDFPKTLKIDKYKEVIEWYKNTDNHCYIKDGTKNQLKIDIANVPHVFGYGGLHGAISKYSGEGYYINMDVASLYPTLMIKYNLMSRNLKITRKYKNYTN